MIFLIILAAVVLITAAIIIYSAMVVGGRADYKAQKFYEKGIDENE